jgi:hypothetical protein
MNGGPDVKPFTFRKKIILLFLVTLPIWIGVISSLYGGDQ